MATTILRLSRGVMSSVLCNEVGLSDLVSHLMVLDVCLLVGASRCLRFVYDPVTAARQLLCIVEKDCSQPHITLLALPLLSESS